MSDEEVALVKARILKAIRDEWKAGFNNTPGLHHQSEDVIKKYIDALLLVEAPRSHSAGMLATT